MAARSARPVRYVATAMPSDEEMERRIAAHKQGRPDSWTVVEAPVELAGAVSSADAEEFLVVDCVTLWISNLMVDHDDATIMSRVGEVVRELAARRLTVVVSNEVGSGLVPMDPIGRRFRDLQGDANQEFAAASARSYLVIAGKTLELGSFDAG